jgi:hypothetical protein
MATVGLLVVETGLLVGAVRLVLALDAAGRLAYEGESAAEYLCQGVPVPDVVDSVEREACIDRWMALGPGGAVIDGLAGAAEWSLLLIVPGAVVLLLADGGEPSARGSVADGGDDRAPM